MPEYVYNPEREDENEYEIKPAQLKRVANYDSKVNYLNTLNFAQMVQESQRNFSMPDTNYTYNPDDIEESEQASAPLHAEDVEAMQAGDQLMQEAVAAAQQEATGELDEALNEIATNKFNALVANDRKQAQAYLDSVKKAHPKDYDQYIEGLRKTKYYQKCLEKWKKYYAEIKEKCVESAKAEIEAHAKSEAGAEVEHEAVVAPKANKPEEANAENLEVKKYVPKHISTNMVADKNLKKTISEILIDKLYDSLDESSDMYKKLAAKNNPENEDAKTHITDFRSSLSNMLQQAHNKLYPKRSGVYAPAYKDMQKNVANHSDKMTVGSTSDLFILKMKDKIIPELAETLTLRVQEVLLTNEIPNFNISKDTAREIIEKLTDKAELYDTVTEANNAVNGKLEITNMLMAEKKAMAEAAKNNQNFVYDAELFVAMRDKLEENRKNNVGKMNQTDYIRLESAIDVVEDFEKKLTANEQPDAQDKANMKATYEDIKKIRDLAKVEEKLSEDTSKKLFGKNDGIQLVFDYLVADYIESASNAEVRGSLSTFNYTDEDVKVDIQRTKEFLDKNNALNPVITSTLLDRYSISLQDSRNKLSENDKDAINTLSQLIDKVADKSIELENDEILQETGNPTNEDMKRIEYNQAEAMGLVNDVVELSEKHKKLKISFEDEEVKEMKLGE